MSHLIGNKLRTSETLLGRGMGAYDFKEGCGFTYPYQTVSHVVQVALAKPTVWSGNDC